MKKGQAGKEGERDLANCKEDGRGPEKSPTAIRKESKINRGREKKFK